MEKLVKILEQVKIGTLPIEQAEQQVLVLFAVSYSNSPKYNVFVWFYNTDNNEIKSEIKCISNEYQENIIRNKPETLELRLL